MGEPRQSVGWVTETATADLPSKSVVLEPSVRRQIIIHRKLTGPGDIVTGPSSPFLEMRALGGRGSQGDGRPAGERSDTSGRARNAARIACHYAVTGARGVHRQGHKIWGRMAALIVSESAVT